MARVLGGEPLLKAVYDFCAARRGARRMPARADIDPVELPRFALPNLVLLDIFEGGERFRWRLTGTGVVDRFGRDATGRFGEEVLTGQYLDFLTSLVRQVCRRGVPVYSHAVFRWEAARMMAISRLFLPLGDETAGVTQILGAHDFGTRAAPVRRSVGLMRDVREIEELVREELPFEAAEPP